MDNIKPYRGPLQKYHLMKYARASWQRLGHIKMLCAVASPSNSTNLEGISSKFQNHICKLIPIPEEHKEQIFEYIKDHRYIQYPLEKGIPYSIELQDYYLADPTLPSNVGALTGRLRPVDYLHMEYVEIPPWAVSLRLMREGNYTLTDRGKILTILTKLKYHKHIHTSFENNPFFITNGEKFIFLYSLLEADGDILKKIYQDLSQKNDNISIDLLKNSMLKESKKLLSNVSSSRSSIFQQQDINVLQSMIKTLERYSDQIVIPRIEPLVDCYFIQRTNRQRNTYKITEGSKSFLNIMDTYLDIDSFLEDGLAKSTATLLNIQNKSSKLSLRSYLSKSYLNMRSGLGYCSIRELALLTVALAIDDGKDYFEISDVERELVVLSKQYGQKIRYTKNRQGIIALVRIDTQLAESFNEQNISN
jgi:hypothetical protein